MILSWTDLNSNMIILKGPAQVKELKGVYKFKFQYDNT